MQTHRERESKMDTKYNADIPNNRQNFGFGVPCENVFPCISVSTVIIVDSSLSHSLPLCLRACKILFHFISFLFILAFLFLFTFARPRKKKNVSLTNSILFRACSIRSLLLFWSRSKHSTTIIRPLVKLQ